MFSLPSYLRNLATFKWTKSYYTNSLARNMSSDRKVKIAVVQLNSTENKTTNFATAQALIQNASKEGAKMAFLPECFDQICPSRQDTLENGEPIDGPTVCKYRELAKANKIWLSLGGLHEKDVNSEDSRLFNAHIILSDNGDIISIYRKIHLFNLDIPGTRLVESEFSQPGNAVIKPVATPCGNVGQGICYDLRFAEFAISLAKAGADILTYPSSFTVPTGKAHWETLLRARAIETQCYVIAAGQAGVHNAKRSSYGHSMIVDPWGVVLAHITDDKPGFATADIDFDYLKEVRSRLPVWTDRKPELYGYVMPANVQYNNKIPQSEFKFGEIAIVQPYQIFIQTEFSVGFVNHRPVLPGHVLVSPLRPGTKRMADLTQSEIFDLFSVVKRVQAVIEKIHGATSSTIAIQDGIDAGQSIEHLHVHLLPRKSSDFGGHVDEIYARLQQHDKEGNPFNLRLLTVDEMTAQCQTLKEHLLI